MVNKAIAPIPPKIYGLFKISLVEEIPDVLGVLCLSPKRVYISKHAVFTAL